MNKKRQKKLLVTGCHHSVTTLLAAMLSCHKDISLLVECRNNDFEKILSKKYVGVKQTIPSILFDKKRTKLYSDLVPKIYKLLRFFGIYKRGHEKGICTYCIKNFLNDKIIFISRNKEENIKSIINRTKQNEKTAEKDFLFAEKIKNKLISLKSDNIYFTTAFNLTSQPEKEMGNICRFLNINYNPSMLNGYLYTVIYDYNNKILVKK